MTPPAQTALVVMAKAPEPGRVKTRLAARWGRDTAAAIHEAMLRCVLERAERHLEAPGGRCLALDPGPDARAPRPPAGWRVLGQGTGGLGERIAGVWRALGAGPAVFLGADSPDVPGEALASPERALADGADAAAGPTEDGGYWTIAAARPFDALLTGIDWGTDRVYDQTRAAAARAGLRLKALPAWRDVDEPSDLEALAHRLRGARERPLEALRRRIETLCDPEAPA